MFYYNIFINNGVEAFGTEGKTITVNEVLQTADIKALAREIHHENMLIPEQVAESVLENFCKAAVNLMAQGFAIQLKNGEDVMMRIYPDIHLKSGNINLQKARELMPEDVHTEEDMVRHASDLVSRVGVNVRAYTECGRKFTELLKAGSSGVQRKDIVEREKIMRKDSDEDENPGTGGGGTNNGGSTPDPGSGGGGTGDNGGNSGGGGGDNTPGGDE